MDTAPIIRGLHTCLLLLALLLPGAGGLQAGEVYRWVDPSGNVVYSDAPPGEGARDAETVRIRPVRTEPAFRPPPQQPEPPPAREPARRPYVSFRIIHPPDDSVVRDNSGAVVVELALEPPLQPGDEVAVYLDGRPRARGPQTRFELDNIDRGTHTLQARVLDALGNEQVGTSMLGFTLKRVSLLFKKPEVPATTPNRVGRPFSSRRHP